MAKKTEANSEYKVALKEEQINEIVEQRLRQSLSYAIRDVRTNPKFAGPETIAYIEAVKIVIDWWSHPDKWGKYE